MSHVLMGKHSCGLKSGATLLFLQYIKISAKKNPSKPSFEYFNEPFVQWLPPKVLKGQKSTNSIIHISPSFWYTIAVFTIHAKPADINSVLEWDACANSLKAIIVMIAEM